MHISAAKAKLMEAKISVETSKKALKAKQAVFAEAKAQLEAADSERKALAEQEQSIAASVKGIHITKTFCLFSSSLRLFLSV